MLATLRKEPDKQRLVVSSGQQRYSIQELIERVERLQAQLEALAVRRLALCADNGLDWLVVDLACQDSNLCLLPLPTFFSSEQHRHATDSVGVDCLIARPDDILDPSNFNQRGLPASAAGTDLNLYHLQPGDTLGAVPEMTGKITFTSGSTGKPRGVCLSHEQQLHQAMLLKQQVAIDSPRHLCILPLSTLLENIAGVYAPLFADGEIVVPSLSSLGFSGSTLAEPGMLLESIGAAEPDTLILVPELLRLLTAAVHQGWEAPSSLAFIAVGGSHVSPKLISDARNAGLPVFEGYGLSECCSVVSLNRFAAQRTGTCGKALPGLDVFIADNEIIVRGNCMLGYVNEPDTWYPHEIRTGDLGEIDEYGFLSIRGRRKNILINSFGRNISPEWVEAELLTLPGIARAVVFGDRRPYCVALIATQNANQSKLDIGQRIERMNARLPDYARIRDFAVVPALLSTDGALYTENGRPRRVVIAAHYADLINSLYRNFNAA